MKTADILIVGAGIVGLATAVRTLQRDPTVDLLIIEKERQPAEHQTGRNSGVIHSGIYYRPGSLKAELCVRGRAQMEAFCEEQGVAWHRCGKVIVAADDDEATRLETIKQNGEANGVPSEWLDGAGLTEHEPHIRGVAGLFVPSTGIVDYAAVARAMKVYVARLGGRFAFEQEVIDIERSGGGHLVRTADDAFSARRVVNCAGLYADRIAAMTGHRPDIRIVPFRGEYYRLAKGREHLCRGLIYPVPDPRFPFLGVHLTRTVEGDVLCGPNAVLAMSREGYDWVGYLSTRPRRGAQLAGLSATGVEERRIWCGGAVEVLVEPAFTRSLQRLVPGVRGEDLVPARAGVRAQALHRDGTLAEDFVIVGDDRVTHVCNAPSPAATSSLAMGERLAGRVLGGSASGG